MPLFRFNPFSGRSGREPATGSVAVGDRFYKPGQRGSIWTVIRVFKPTSNALTHVVLERGGENPETFVISLESLMNPHMFRRDRRDPESVNVTDRQRRWTDRIKEELAFGVAGKAARGDEDTAESAHADRSGTEEDRKGQAGESDDDSGVPRTS